jgi:hypothetical protein
MKGVGSYRGFDAGFDPALVLALILPSCWL